MCLIVILKGLVALNFGHYSGDIGKNWQARFSSFGVCV